MESTDTTPIDEFDIIEKAAAAELHGEYTAAAQKKLKVSLKQIMDSKRITANLELDHEALKNDLRAGRLDAEEGYASRATKRTRRSDDY